MRDIEQLQRQQTEPATEAVVSECFIHSYYSSGISPFSSISGRNHVAASMCEESTLQYICTIVYVYTLWHDKQIYIQHFKIMKNVQPGHLYFPVLSLSRTLRLPSSSSSRQRKEEFNYIFLGKTYTKLLGRILRARRGSCRTCSMTWMWRWGRLGGCAVVAVLITFSF